MMRSFAIRLALGVLWVGLAAGSFLVLDLYT
jgi:hypothetical protein